MIVDAYSAVKLQCTMTIRLPAGRHTCTQLWGAFWQRTESRRL